MIEGYEEAVESGDPTKLAVSVTEAGELPSGEEAFVFAGGLEFEKSGEKVIRKIRFLGRGSVEVRVASDRGEKVFSLNLDENAARELALKGKSFDLTLSFSTGACVEKIEFEYDVLGGK